MWKILFLIFLSSVKFAFSPSTAIAQDFSYLETLIITISGGVIGILFFTYLTKYIVIFWNWFLKKTNIKKAINKLIPKKNKKSFTRKNKLIIKAKSSYGLIGIAFLTPIFLSIPVGTFLATRFFPNKKITILYLVISVIIWSNILTIISVILKEYI